MASKTYRPGMEGQLARDLKAHARRMMVEFHQQMHAEAREVTDHLTPVDTGAMKGRWGDRVDSRDRVPAGKRDNLRLIKLGSSSAAINDDAGAAAIDHGRKRNFYKHFSRMGGSPQAPSGISKPARRHLLGYAPTAAARAIAITERRFGKP